MKSVSLHDLLEEIRLRDEAIDNLVVAYFKLEKEHAALQEVVGRKEVPMGVHDNLIAWVLDSTPD